VTVSLDSSENLVNTDVLARLSEDLSKCCRVKVIAPCASITLVGRGMRSLLHRLSEIWATFGQERVHLISQSSNDLNLTFVIDEADAEGMMASLHAQLIASGAMPVHEPGVFGPRWNELSGTVRVRGPRWWEGEHERLLDIAAGGTPAYAYHLPTVRERARALAAIEPVDRRFFAIKANPHPAILNALVEEGFGLECVSLGELRHAFASVPGLAAERVLFTPSFAPIEEYAAAFELGVTVTLDNVEALRRWPEVFRGQRLWLRVDLGRGEGHHAKVRTGGVASKFGLPVPRIDEFLEAARGLGILVDGLHAHLGSGVDTPEHWRSVCDELGGIANRIGSIDTIDIGGGLPIPYRAEDEPFDLDAWSVGLAEVKVAYPGYRMAIEPGRYMVAESGVLLLTATQVVEKQGVRRVGGDAGMNALMRPALYEAWHDIANLSRLDDKDTADFDVVGPICETGDVLGQKRPLPAATAPGDVLLVADAGAYGFVMSNTYNLRELPRVEILE
ncbi:MAG: bifunctional aspartate kinase/diaminopimelate decarboxylase, partial [Gammaproteobacteria bacterium]|nr:bifunctional aspartate kinase/diaminopimelate decarboxylase [Gammaproteobacteria bacterium]